MLIAETEEVMRVVAFVECLVEFVQHGGNDGVMWLWG